MVRRPANGELSRFQPTSGVVGGWTQIERMHGINAACRGTCTRPRPPVLQLPLALPPPFVSMQLCVSSNGFTVLCDIFMELKYKLAKAADCSPTRRSKWWPRAHSPPARQL
jgi:hypothetical protein